MTDLIGNSQSWLAGKFRDFASQPAVYSRGTVTQTLRITLGRNALIALGEPSNLTLNVTQFDLLIAVSELMLDSVAAEPKRGDRITTDVGGATLTLEVLPIASEQAFYHDPHKTVYRVHVKRIA